MWVSLDRPLRLICESACLFFVWRCRYWCDKYRTQIMFISYCIVLIHSIVCVFSPHENSYSIKHITRSIQANSIYYILEYDTCILENWLRIDDKKRYKQQHWNCEMSNKCQLDKQTNENEASKSGKISNEMKWKHNLQHQTEKEQ